MPSLKSETKYKCTVVRLLGKMRLDGQIPFAWIADEQPLDDAARTYRRREWDAQDAYVEMWLEKDALAGVLYKVTECGDVPLKVTRGYPSLSNVHEAAEAIAATGKPAHLYYSRTSSIA